MFYDEDAKQALSRLKEPTRKLHDEEAELFLSELDSSGDRHRTTMTLCGYKGGSKSHQINQDRSLLVSPYLNDYQMVGVLDGHGTGGEIVSEYARTQIPIKMSAKLDLIKKQREENLMHLDDATTEKIKEALKEVFSSVDKEAVKEVPRTGGATASVALQIGGKLFVANSGDSTTLVAAHRAWNESNVIVYGTREDKPDLPHERARIEKAGGTVQIKTGESSRVLYKDPVSKMQVGLAMSRSIGDWDAPGVTAEPIVDVLDLTKLADTLLKGKEEFDCDNSALECGPPDVNFFVVSATDGLVDFVSHQDIVDKIGITFFGRSSLQDRSIGVGAGHPHLAAEELIYLAAKGWHEEMQGSYRDDITVAATKIFPWEFEP